MTTPTTPEDRIKAVEFVTAWLDDDENLRIPDTEWGYELYAHLRTLTALFPAAETVREWGVRPVGAADIWVAKAVSREEAVSYARYDTQRLSREFEAVSRTRTRYADHVGPWEVAEDA